MLVQFGNNWMKKIPLTAKLGLGLRPRPILAVLGIFFIQLFPNWTACSPITYTTTTTTTTTTPTTTTTTTTTNNNNNNNNNNYYYNYNNNNNNNYKSKL